MAAAPETCHSSVVAATDRCTFNTSHSTASCLNRA